MVEQIQKDTRFWDRAARKYATDPIADLAGYDATLKAVSEQLHIEDHVLEIGCGTGSTALSLASATGSYLATDLSPEMIAIAREKLALEDIQNLSFDVSKPSFDGLPESHYDAVLAFNLLHLVPSSPETIAAIYRLLKPGGIFISKTPCLSLINPMIRMIIPVMKWVGKAPSVSILTPEMLQDALRAAGFVRIEQDWHGTKGKDVRPYFVAYKPSSGSA